MKERTLKEGLSGAKIMKRLFSIVIALAMVFTLMPMNSMTVYAESGTNTKKYASVKTAEQLTTALADSTVDVITVENDITVNSSTENSKSATAIFTVDRTVLIESTPGHQYTIKRSTSSSTDIAKSLFEIWGNDTYDGIQASFENIILDGGAVWTAGSTAKTRWDAYAQESGSSKNSGVRGRAVVDVANKGTLNLESGAVIQNGDTCTNSTTRNCGTVGSANYGGGVRIEYDTKNGGGTVNLKVGSVIQDVVSHQWGGAIGAYNYGRLNIYGGTIRRCASQQGAAICCTYKSGTGYDKSTASTMKMYGGLIENCYSKERADICMDGTNPTYNEIYGGTFVNTDEGTAGAIYVTESAGMKIDASKVNRGSLSYTNESSVAQINVSTKKITFKDGETTVGELDLLYDPAAGKTTSAGASFPADLVKDHAVFLGWYDGENKVNSESTFSDDTTVCAKWGIHQWTYIALGNKLTAKCIGTGNGCTMPSCEYSTDESAINLTISSNSLTYSGSVQGLSDSDLIGLSDFNTAIGLSLSSADVKYWTEYNDSTKTATTAENSGASGTNAAPVKAGTYYATLTVDTDKTAVIDYSIKKAPASVSLAPAANTLTYDGSEQELVTAGDTSDGTLYYALSSNGIIGDYSTDIPKATNAGDYEVYYGVKGDDNHTNKKFETPVLVTINKAVFAGTKTVSGNVLAGYASSNEGIALPDIPENMVYGTPTYSLPITSATVTDNAGAGNKVIKFSANDSAVASTEYEITIPVSEEAGKSANYSDYNITLTLTGFDCTHQSTAPVAEVAATCTANGTKEHDVCSVCGSELIGGVVKTDDELKIDKKGHDFKIKSSENVMTIYCSRCSEAGSVTVSATSPKEAGKASEITIGTEAEKSAWEAIGYSVSNNKVEHYRGTIKLDAAPTTDGKYTAKVTVSTNGLIATAEAKYTIGDVTKYATDYDVIYTKPVDESKLKKGVTIESSDGKVPAGIITVNSKLKITMLSSEWSAKAYAQQRVTPENVTGIQWTENEKAVKKFASVKYNKKQNKTLIKTKQNKKVPGGVYAVKLEDKNGNIIYLNIECIELNKAIKKNCLYTSTGISAVSANDLLFIEDGDNATTVALTMLKSDNKTRSEFNSNGVKWKAGKGKKAVAINEDEVIEYKDKKGNVIGYLTLDEDGTVKVVAGAAKGKINLTATVNGKTYKTVVTVKKKK